jgi:hypothetical protein
MAEVTRYLVTLTPESVAKRPLNLPIFEIVGGRRGEPISCRSPEGMRILYRGRGVVYLGSDRLLGSQVRDVGIKLVLEEALRNVTACPDAFDHSLELERAITEHIKDIARFASSTVLSGWAV